LVRALDQSRAVDRQIDLLFVRSMVAQKPTAESIATALKTAIDVADRELAQGNVQLAKASVSPSLSDVQSRVDASKDIHALLSLAVAVDFGLDDEKLDAGQRMAWINLAQGTVRKAQELLSPQVRERDPKLSAEVDRINDRLKDPKFYLEEVKASFAAGRLDDAHQSALQGIARHPGNASLWDLLMKTQAIQAQLQNRANGAALADILLNSVERLRLIAPELTAEHEYWRATALEHQGKLVEAAEAYEAALAAPRKDTATLLSKAEAGRARVALSLLGLTNAPR
jgi:tetratricopeptide (TPR) repeat protein